MKRKNTDTAQPLAKKTFWVRFREEKYLQFMICMKFSKRLVLVYTCIVIIPLFLLVCIISFIVERRQRGRR